MAAQRRSVPARNWTVPGAGLSSALGFFCCCCCCCCCIVLHDFPFLIIRPLFNRYVLTCEIISPPFVLSRLPRYDEERRGHTAIRCLLHQMQCPILCWIADTLVQAQRPHMSWQSPKYHYDKTYALTMANPVRDREIHKMSLYGTEQRRSLIPQSQYEPIISDRRALIESRGAFNA